MISKNNFFLLVLFTVISTILYYFLNPKKKKNIKLTKIYIKEKTIKVGEIGLDDKVKVKFEFINKGENSLIISKVKPSCHCTVPNWSNTPIKFEEKGIIEVEYNGDYLGYFQQDILVFCNVKDSPLLFTIQGKRIK